MWFISDSYTKRRSSPYVGYTADSPIESTPAGFLELPGHQVASQNQSRSSDAITPFTPVGRYSMESASTAKGLLDWNVVGNNIGYENMSTIDWMNEYRKEKLRAGRAKTYVSDSAKLWLILLVTGLSVGLIAAGIDVVVNWLADLKLGYCSSGFYLSKEFCCLGDDNTSKIVLSMLFLTHTDFTL